LFSGAGGLAVGFRQAGWSILAANDADKEAGATFRLNFPEAVFFEGPIAQVTSQALMKACGLRRGELDCLIGGPPCQSFSYNNHQRSAADDRARLFECYLRLVEGLNPKTLVMENVPGIKTIGDGKVVAEIQQRLKELGFATHMETLSSEKFGTPQIRKRVFIVATRLGGKDNLIPAPKQRRRLITVGQAIGDLPRLANGGGEHVARRSKVNATTSYQRGIRGGAQRLFNHVCHALTEVNLKRVLLVPEGGNWRDIPHNLLPKGMQRAKKSDHTKRYGRLSRDGLASTILTKCDPHWGAYIHPRQHRTISVREAARLQGFPDSFRFAGEHLSKQYEQVGNAVPVTVANAIGSKVLAHVAKRKAAARKSEAKKGAMPAVRAKKRQRVSAAGNAA
jgi:DNA (cytosine-5)-methyltransferase 1